MKINTLKQPNIERINETSNYVVKIENFSNVNFTITIFRKIHLQKRINT